ncbi:MAG: TolC family protein [Cytophagaceae bacterium]|nr:TolC family protein [Cytophagaceae bacterium]
MRKYLFKILIFVFVNSVSGFAQKNNALTLESCLEMAINNNFDVKIAGQKANISVRNLEQSQKEKLPTLSTDFSQGFNLGRNIDPVSNQYVTQPINSATLGLTSSTTLYKGDIIKNTVSLNEKFQKSAMIDAEILKFDLKKAVTLAFLEVVLKQEILDLKIEQKKIIETQITRNNALIELGNLPKSSLIELKAQLENETLGILEAENQLLDAKNYLKKIMNTPELEIKEVKEPLVQDLFKASINKTDNLVGVPLLLQKKLNVDIAENQIKLKEGTKKPSLFFTGGLFTNYSSQANRRIKFIGEPQQVIQVSENQFISINGNNFPLNVVSQVPKTEEVRFGYLSQLFSNIGLGLKLNLEYPILDKNYRNTQIQISKIEKQIAQSELQKAETEVKNDLLQIKTQLENSKKLYLQAQKYESAQNEAFKLSKERFEEGMNSFVEYNQTKLSLEAAKSNVIRNKYTHYFYNLVYKYYTGN